MKKFLLFILLLPLFASSQTLQYRQVKGLPAVNDYYNGNSLSPNFKWDTTTTTALPYGWRDGTRMFFKGDTAIIPFGWGSDGVNTWSSDSSYQSVPPYHTWTLRSVRFPIATHWVACGYNPVKKYWIFCGGDPSNTTAEQKSIWTTTDFITYRLRTSDYGGSKRILGVYFYDYDGNDYWGLGASDVADTSHHLDDIWKSTDEGGTWTQIVTGLNYGGFTLGGNDGNQAIFRAGYVYFIQCGGKYGGTKTYSKRNFKAPIDNLFALREIDTIPLTNGVQYPSVALFNYQIWSFNGHNGTANTVSACYLDEYDKWHTYHLGGFTGEYSLNISHAQAVGVKDNNQLFLGPGNDNNEIHTLKRTREEFVDSYKIIHGNLYIGGYNPYNFYLNTQVGSEPANTFVNLDAGSTNPTYTTKVWSNASFPIGVFSKSVSNNLTGLNINNVAGLFSGHATGTYSGILSGVYDLTGSNNIPFYITTNYHTIIGNNSASKVTNTSVLQVIGLTRSAGTGSKKMLIYDTATGKGDFYYTDIPTGSGTQNSKIRYGIKTDLDTTNNVVYDTTLNRVWILGLDGYRRQLAVSDSESVYDADAIAYFDAEAAASNNLSLNDKIAINNFIVGLKSNSIWSKIKQFNILKWGSFAKCAINLKSPGTFDLSSSNGTITYGATGATGNASTGYINTGLNPSTDITSVNSSHIAVYIRTHGTSNNFDAGCYSTGIQMSLASNLSGETQALSRIGNDAISAQGNLNPDATGFFVGTRTSSTRIDVYQNGTSLANSTTSNASGFPNYNVYLLAINGANSLVTPTNAETSFYSIGDGLSSTDVTNYNTLIQALKTALGL